MLIKVMVRADFRCDGQIIPIAVFNTNNAQYIRSIISINRNTFVNNKCVSRYLCQLDNNCDLVLYFDNLYWYIDK